MVSSRGSLYSDVGRVKSALQRHARTFLTAAWVLGIGVATISHATPGTPPYLLKWGSFGSGNGQFDTPSGIAVDASDRIYVADRNNNRIQKFTSSGAFITAWGTFGTGNGQFDHPCDLAFDDQGNVYVADTSNDRIQKFTGTGTYLLQWGTSGLGNGQFRAPRAIAVDRSHNVYVAEDGLPQKRVQKFTSTGSYLLQWGTAGLGDGQFRSPRGVAIDFHGDVYVSDALSNRVQKFTTVGSFLGKWGTEGAASGNVEFPIGVTQGRGGLYVVDSSNHRVQQFSSTGGFLLEFGSQCQLSDATGCVDPDGPGPLVSGDGQFDYPQGIAADSHGNLYVTDSQNHRILKFGPSPLTEIGAGDELNGGVTLLSPNPTASATRVRLQLAPSGRGREGRYRVSARVFDISGRLVRDLDAGELPVGDHVLTWDGTTAEGAPARAGIYILRVGIDGRPDRTLKIVRVSAR